MKRELEWANFAANNVAFTMNGLPLERVNCFCYLGRPISHQNSDWPALHRNLTKAQSRWAMVSRVLTKEGASTRARGMFYRAIVQSVLLCGCETWTITQGMLKALESFHH